MLSKILPASATKLSVPLFKKIIIANTQTNSRRVYSDLIPPSQYDMPWSKRLNILYVMQTYWETIPLFLTNALAIGVLIYNIAQACYNKVDVVFTTHSRENISRTMNLRNPRICKLIIINQRYDPWPEMQDVLDKMVFAERRAILRAQSCAHP